MASVSGEAESAFAELRNRAIHEIDAASSLAAKTHERAKEQVGDLAAGTASAVRTMTEQVVLDVTRIARESGDGADGVSASRELVTWRGPAGTRGRLAALRLPPRTSGERLTVILTELTERAELLRQTSAKVGAVYGEFEGCWAAPCGARRTEAGRSRR